MNELKYINDRFGHEAGDKALTAVADILRDCCIRDARIYRVGGDEFMILSRGATEEELSEMIRRMRERFAPSPYTCAFGLAMRQPDDTQEQFLVAADERMYADKAALKQAVLARGGTLHRRE